MWTFFRRTPAKEIARVFRTTGAPPDAPPRFNLAPASAVLCVRFNPADGRRHLDLLRWGLVPLWAKERAIGAKMINARGETLDEKPAFRDAYATPLPDPGRRILRVADDRARQAAVRHPARRGRPPLFAFAGLWERWRDARRASLRSCTIVTTAANDLMRPIHERMPVILDARDWGRWLGDEPAERGEIGALLRPFPAARLRLYPISTRVNSAACDHEAILEPA